MAAESQQRSVRALLTHDFLIVTAMLFFTGMVGEMFTPTIPQLSLELGADISISGLAGTVFGVAAMLSRPVVGSLTDRLGRRRMALLGLGCYAAVFVCYLFVITFSQLLVVRALQGIATCMVSTALGAIVTDVVPQEKMTEGVALSNVSGAITMSIAPAIGLWVVAGLGFRSLFLLALLLVGVSLLLLLPLRYRDDLISRSGADGVRGKGLQNLLVEPSALLPMLMYLLLSISMTAANVFLPQYAAAANGADTSVFFLILCVGVIYTRMRIGSIVLKLGEAQVVIGGALLYFVCLGALALGTTEPLMAASGLVLGFGYGAAIAVLNGLALRSCAPERRGMAIATFSMGLDIGFAVGSLLWGVVIKFLGYRCTFLLAGAVALLTIPLYLFQQRRLRAA